MVLYMKAGTIGWVSLAFSFSSCDQPAHDAQAWSLIETNDNTYWAIVNFCALNT